MIPRDSLHALFAVLVISQAAFAADWPQWRGPQRTGISTEKGLSRQWPTEGPRLLWQAKAGLDVRLTPRLSLDLGYRYLNGPQFEPGQTGTPAFDTVNLSSHQHIASAGLKYRF